CFYEARHGVLSTGRHLLPDPEGLPRPNKTAKTFHWPRQQRSVDKLLNLFSEETLRYILPGASLGGLTGQKYIDQAYQKLSRQVQST
ncbi:MAG: MBL fold metallo-hydrolase, partial [Cyanobacteria bacterium P01_F01_bin.42]